jgi:hypothetical protein
MINVYLDSSDYSVLSDPNRATDEVQSILSHLDGMREEGSITCWFSSASVSEAAPLAPTFIPAARSRLEMIKRLCGLNCLVHVSTLADIERSAVILRKPPSVDDVRKTNGHWIPSIDAIADEIPTPQQEMQKQVAALGLGRAARRKLEHQIKKKRQQTTRSTVAELCQRYPFNQADEPILTAYFEGRADKEQMLRCLVAAFSDLNRVADWCEKRWDHTAPVFKWIRSSGVTLVENMPRLVEVFVRERQNAINIGMTEDDAIKMLDKIALGIVSRAHRILGRQLLKIDPDAPSDPISDDDLWLLAPGISTMGAAAAHISMRTANDRKSPRTPKESDFGDIAHSSYIPYVDLFRADGFAADVLKKLRSAQSTVIVPRLTELVPEIQKRLAGQSA